MTDKKSITRQIADGAVWTVSFRIVEKLISVVSTIILARLLAPHDFGIIAIAMMVIALLDLLRAFGVDAAIIQKQDADSDDYNTAWTIKIITSAVVALGIFLTADLASQFFREADITAVLQIMALGVFISGFENIGVVEFRKQLNFGKDFHYMIGKKIFSFIATIGLAVALQNYWALAIGKVLTNLFSLGLSFYVHSYRPRLSLVRFRDMTSFSLWMFANALVGFISNQAPQIVIGRISGSSALGTYSVAGDLASTISNSIAMPVHRAAFPGFSKLNNDYARLKQSFLTTIEALSLVLIPSAVGLLSVAPLLVPVALGDKWLDAVPLIEILAIASLLRSLNNVGSLYIALGKPDIVFRIALCRISILLPLMIAGTYRFGAEGAAASIVISAIIMHPIVYWPARKILNIRFLEVMAIFYRPALASALMYAVVAQLFLGNLAYGNLNLSIKLLILGAAVALGGVVFILTMLAFWFARGRPECTEKKLIITALDKIPIRFGKLGSP